MNYIRIDGLKSGDYKECSANGTGFNVILWCAGCDIHCEGCHNQQLWDFHNGKEFDDNAMKLLISEMSHPMIDGLTLLGGEPMSMNNVDCEIKIVRKIKELFPNKKIWCFSGHYLDDLMKNDKQKELLSYCDYLVDGPFIKNRRNISLRFRGSDNQTIWEKDTNDLFVKSKLN